MTATSWVRAHLPVTRANLDSLVDARVRAAFKPDPSRVSNTGHSLGLVYPSLEPGDDADEHVVEADLAAVEVLSQHRSQHLELRRSGLCPPVPDRRPHVAPTA